MRVLVTGGGGFLGKAVALRLRAQGHEVASFSRGRYPELERAGIASLTGDLADAAGVASAARGCDAVVHAAAKAGIWGSPREYERTNVEGTANVLAACRLHGISRLVYTSSPSVVYHGGDIEGWDESAPYPSRFEAHYARTKAQAEKLVLEANGPALATVALRPHLIWGPGDPHLIPRVLAKARSGRLRLIDRRKPALVDCIHVDNAADAHVQALERLRPGAAIAGRAYFLSQGEPIEIGALIARILEAAGLPPCRKRVSARAAYVAGGALEAAYSLLRRRDEPPMTRFLARQLSTSHWFDIGRARRELGYVPRVSLDEGFAGLKRSFERCP